MYFTHQEFSVMVDELLYQEPVSYDMLCCIAEKTLWNSVVSWCRKEDCLRGRGYEEDLMQEIYLRLIKTTVDYFLLRNGVDGPVNNDPEGFEDWMFRVADNLKRDFVARIRNRDYKTTDMEDPELENIPDVEYDDGEEQIEKLKKAFSIVLSSDVGIYKILTWLAQFVFILDEDITKIKSNDLILHAFRNKTLYEMFEMIMTASKRIPWIVVTEQQRKRIMDALKQPWKGGIVYGDVRFSEFFMKHNGTVSGKKSISDWMNRMNNMIRRETEADNISRKANKKIIEQLKKKKGGGEDEASDS